MRAADDATVIDTNQLDLEAVVGEVLRHIREQS
jgi:cytidylate kinase